jgi:endonuclease/exonuclease/phosphatase family metal-dependent hydrolase
MSRRRQQQQQQQQQQPPPQAVGAPRLRVLTFNAYAGPPAPWSHQCKPLQSGRRLRHQAERVAALEADIICLQEVLADSARAMYIKALAADYEPSFARDTSRWRSNLRKLALLLIYTVVVWLCWRQPTWSKTVLVAVCCLLVCTLAILTTIWAFLFGDTHPAGLLIFTKRSRLAKLGKPTASPFSTQEGDWMNVVRPRGALWQRLQILDDKRGRLLVVGNAHADALSKEVPWREQTQSVLQPSAHRREQLCELFAEGASRAKKDGRARVLVAGDFNTGRRDDGWLSSREADPRRKGFVDAWQCVHRHSQTTGAEHSCFSFDSECNSLASGGQWSPCRETLDYIFAHETSGLEAKEARLVMTETPHLSDHFGVLVDFEIK